VLLYELLTGELPFSRKELHAAGYLEMQRVIREQEPTKPSTKVTTLGERVAALAQMRAMTRGDFGKALRGDLDWITLKALEKDRTRRYATAQELAADLDRYRKLEPVLATPPSWGYRAKKFVRKYRVQCVAAVVVLGAIVAGGFGMWWKSVEADEQRRIAIQAATEAQRQQKLANESAEAAKASELRAKEQEQLATKRANEIESLAAKDRIYADITRLQDAESRAATLWPAHPSRIPDFERWIADVEPILNRLPEIEKALAEVRLRARSTTVEAIAAARAPIAAEIERLQKDADEAQPRERRAIQKDILDAEVRLEAAGYEFAERADAERHLQLAKLSQLSRSFSKNDEVVAMRGAMVSMRDRLAEAQALAAARPVHQQAWQQAISAIAASDGKTASTLYAHFVLTEQESLVPIGMDPESKLWEFVHLPSGTKGKEIPRRDPSTGRLVPDGDMGIVFVLLPGGTSWVGTTGIDPEFANKRVASLRREIAIATGAAQLEIPELPAKMRGMSASKLTSYAWQRCAPEKDGDDQDRMTFGEEALALAAAHAAVQEATGTATESTYLDTLAWALVANGQDAEAMQRSAEALAKAPAEERSEFEGYQRAIDAAIAQRADRLRAAEAKAAEPKGTGCPNYDPQRKSNETPHRVNLTPYFLSKYEMTQGQWLRLAGRNPSHRAKENNLALPVESVSWFDCEEWMRLRSLSLPTEAQWEVGCRGGTTTPWWTGADENDLKAKENVGGGNLAVVGSKCLNPFGLCDTHGNAWEWCLDSGSSDTTPREGDGFRSGGSPYRRSFRGDYFGFAQGVARAGSRDSYGAYARLVDLGLRPARTSRL
jgi:formylglycine-generating enzyme required for sulfatase activity